MISLVEDIDGRPSQGPNLELTILMPCLNEAETIASFLKRNRD
jgi:hypothetical protein